MSPDIVGPRPEVRVIGLRRCSRGALLGGTALRAAALVVLATQAKAQLAPGAHPTGGAVVGGSASITQAGNTTDITQKSGRAAIDWQSFNVGSNARVVFAQPSSSSVVLNTVVGPNPSEIAGRITANGVVAIVNQSGVIFDQGSQVDTAGLVVSAAGISRQNFMAGHMVFDQAPHPGAAVVNNGAITIGQAGLAALVAPQVINNGVITAKLGRVILGGAATYTLDLYGDGLLALNVTGQVTQVTLGGRTMPALVTNAGTILADGGTVVLNAAAADGLIRTLVEAGGSISASSVGSQAGRVLVQGIGGSVDIAGAVSATGAAPGTAGGTIVANATGTVSLASTARIDASGANGGGLVAIGTTAARAASRSAHPTLTAQAVHVAAGASIAANAVTQGSGGDVTLLSTGTTSLDGVIAVRGGAAGGNGGLAEISGEIVGLTGSVDSRAPLGRIGSMLIDPSAIVVSDVSPSAASLGTTWSWISDTSLSASTTGITLSAPGNIAFAYQATKTNTVSNTTAGQILSVTSSGGNISVDAGFTLTSVGSLTLSAGHILEFDSTTGTNVFGLGAGASTSSVLEGPVVSLTGTTGISLGGASITGSTSLALTAASGQIAGNDVITTPLLTATAGTGIGLIGANVITATGAIDDTTSGNITIDNAGALAINGVITAPAASSVSLAVSTGALTEGAAGGIVAGTLTGSVSAGSASLTSLNNAFGTLGAFSTVGGASNLFLYDTGAVDVTGIVSAGGALGLDSLPGSTSKITVASTGSLAAGGGSPIQLGANAFALTGGVTTTGVVSFGRGSSGALNLGGAADNFGGLGVTAVTAGTIAFGSISGSTADFNTTSLGISQSVGSTGVTLGLYSAGGITEATASVITAKLLEGGASGAVLLTGTNAVGTLGAFSTTGSLQFTDGRAIDVTGTVHAGGSVLAIASTGAGAASAIDVAVGGALTSAGSITLQADAFDFAGSVNTAGLVALARNSSGALTFTGAAGDSFGGDGFGNITAGTLALGSLDGATAASNTTSIAISGNLSSPATTLGLFATGAITEGGADVITASVLEGGASGAVNLIGANAVTTLGGFASSGGSLAFDNAQSLLTTGTQSASTGLALTITGAAHTLGLGGTLTGASVTLASTGDINQTAGKISTTDLAATSSAGSIGLGLAANLFGTVTTINASTTATLNDGEGFALAGPVGGTTVSLTAAGTISQGSGGVITATDLTGSATGPVALTAANVVGTLTSFSTTGGGFAFDDTGTLKVTGLVQVNTSTDTLLLNVPTLDVTNTGSLVNTGGVISLASDALTLAGTVTTGAAGLVGIDRLTAGALSIGAAGFPTVTTGTLAIGSLDGTTTGNVSAIHITGALSVPATLDLFTSGALTSVAGISVGTLTGHVGTASFAGSDTVGTLKNFAVDSGGLALTDTGSLIITGTVVATGGTLNLDAGGSITERTGGVLSGSVTATSLTGSASGSIDLGDSANAIGTIATSLVATGGPLVLTDSSALHVDGAVNSGAGLTLSVTGIGHALALDATAALTGAGTVLLSATGPLTEDPAATISATTLTGSAGGSIALIGSNSFGTLGPLSSGAGLTLDDGHALTTTGSVSAVGALAITVSTGALSIGTGSAGDGITGASVALESAGQLTQFAGGSITATAGNISLTSDTAGIAFGGTLAAPSGAVQFAALSGTVTETDGTTAGAINAVSASGTAQSISLTGANAAATLTNLDATAGNLTIDEAPASATPTITTAGTLSSTGTLAITLSGGASTLSLGGALTAPTVALSAPAGIGQTAGGIEASTLTAVSSGGAVALTSTSNQVVTLGASSAAGGFAFTDSATSAGLYQGTLTETGPVSAGSLSTLALRAPSLTITGNLSAPGGTVTLSTDLLDLTGEVSTNAGTGVVGIDTFAGTTLTIGTGNFAGVSTGILALGSLNGTAVSGPINTIDITTDALALTSSTPTLGLFTSATGTVTASAGITVGTLVGNAGTVSITGANDITALGDFTAHGGLTFAQPGSLDVAGAVDGGPSAGISLTQNAATLTVGGAGSVTASATTLSAGNLTISGSATGTNTLVLIATTGTITDTGALNTDLLSGSTAGTAFLIGGTGVTSIGNFSSDGFNLSDGQNLSITGTLSGGAGGITLASSANLDIPGSLITTGNIVLSSGGTIGEASGGLTAASLSGGAVTSANLSGTNDFGTLNNFTAGTSLKIADGEAMSVAGTITSPVTTLTANSIDVTGTIAATTSLSLTSTAGRITEEGSITAGSLTGSSGTHATGFTGTNDITDLGDFVASGFNFDQTPALTVTGNVQAGASATFSIGGSLGIASTGTIAATNVGVTAASVAESGAIVATTLTGTVTGDADLAGANTITSIGNLSAATIELDNSTSLTLAGSLTGTQSIALSLPSGTLTLDGTVTGSTTSLTAAAMSLEGGIDAATSLTLSATGTIEQHGGGITTPLMLVSAVGTAEFGGTNAVGTLGAVTVTGSSAQDIFFFDQTGSLTLAGPISSDANVAIGSSAALTDAGSVTASAIDFRAGSIGIGGTIHGSASVTLVALGGGITEQGGTIMTPELTGSAQTSANFSGSNTITALGDFSAASFALLDAGVPLLTINGPVDIVGALSLTAPALSLDVGEINTGSAFLAATAGPISGGIGVTGSLTGTSTGSTDLNGAIGTLGVFTAAGFTLFDSEALSVTGPLSGGASASIQSTGALTVGGAVDATNVSLTGLSILISATGTVGASGLILSAFGDTTPGDGTIVENAAAGITAGILSGSAQGSASLVGVNSIGTLTAFSAAPLTVHDTSALTIQGSVTGSYTPSASAPVFGAVALDLPGQALTITGTLNATGEPVSISAGSVAETGTVIAASLTGTTSGATHLTSFNAISAVGSYTAAGFALDDNVTLLSVNGPVQGGATAFISNFGTATATGNMQVNGSVTATDIALHADQQLTLAAGAVLTATNVALTAGAGTTPGALTEAASAVIDAGTLTGSVQGAASLVGSNTITTLGSFTATGGLTLDDTAGLTIASGSGTILSAPTITLSAASITIDGLIDATTSLSLTATASAGTISEMAGTALQTPLLTITAPGAVTLLGTANLIGSTGAVTVGNLELADAEDVDVTGALVSSNGATITDAGHTVTVSGSITAADTDLVAGDIAVPGLIDTTTLEFAASAIGTATGTISAPGTLIAAGVSGSATGSASLVSATGANEIHTLGGFGAAGFALNDGIDLTVTGAVNGGGSAFITTAGLLTVNGSVAGATTGLTGDGIALTGTLSATDLALVSQGSITGTGSARITAASLTGSATGAVLLTGSNTITNLGSFTATGFDLADTSLLTIGGPLQGGPDVTITDPLALTVTGTITATTLALSIGGTVSETGAIDTTLLEGSVTGSAAFLGTNSIGTIGAFTAAGLTFDDTTDIIIAGPVTSAATTITAAAIDIPGTLTVSDLVVSTPGTIAEGGTLTVTGTLSGSAGGSAAFTGSNSIATIANLTSAGLTLDDSQALLIGGTVSGNASVAITDAGLITVQGGLTGATSALTAAALDVPGTITAGTSLALSIGGTIAEGGSIITPLLTGSATGSAVFSGANTINAIGPFTAAGLVLNDTPDLAVVGAVNGNASVAITDQGALTIPGSVSATTLALTSATGAITETGSITTGTLTGTAATSAAFTGSNFIGTLSDFTATAGLTLDTTPDLAVTGAVSGGPSVTITDAGVLTVTGSITGSATALTGSSINILDPVASPGAITAADTLVLTATSGTITETGSISTALLSGSATGDANLTGTNDIANLGDFTAATLELTDAQALTVTGSVTAATIALTTAALTVDGTLDAPTQLQVTTGAFTSTGTIIAGLLTGSATGGASLTGTDQIFTLGSFTASPFLLIDNSALSVTGPVTGALVTLTAAAIDIPGSIAASGTLSLTATGTITESGSIATGVLDLSSGGSASLTGGNAIATLGDVTAAGLTLDNAVALTVTGAVNGQPYLTLTNGEALTIAGSGSVTGSVMVLNAAGITVAGAIDAATSLQLLTPGSVGETGSIATPHLTGSVGGSADFAGTNHILAVGDFTTGGDFALTDVSDVALDGTLNATSGNITITAADIAQASGAATGTGILSDTATTGSITLLAPGMVSLAGLIDSPTILIGDTAVTPAEVLMTGNTIITGSSVLPATHDPKFPPTNGSKPGIFILTDKFAQTGTTRVNPNNRASVVDISLAKRNGTVSFDPSYSAGLVSPRDELFLNLNFGVASGHIDVAGLSLSYVLPGSTSLTDLYGTIDNETGPAAAGAAYILQPDSDYRFNACPIQSINCILVSPVIVPVTNPVEDVEVTTPRRRRDDDDLIIPNVGEQDF